MSRLAIFDNSASNCETNEGGVRAAVIETSQWMLELELAWRDGIRGSSAGVAETIKRLNDPYLEKIDLGEFLKNSLEYRAAFSKYRLLVWLVDNLPYFQKQAEPMRQDGAAPKHAWMFWDAGWDNAPAIAQACAAQAQRTLEGWDFHFLDDTNWRKYATEPASNSINLVSLKRTSPAHWSDWLRGELLAHHGGVWIDASAYITPAFLDTINCVDEHCNTVWAQRSISYHQISNWLLYGQGYCFTLVNAALNLWLKNHDAYQEYFFYHALWYFLSQLDETFAHEWDTTPYLASGPGFQLWKRRNETVSDNEFEALLGAAPAHKLNVRWNPESRLAKDSVAARLLGDCNSDSHAALTPHKPNEDCRKAKRDLSALPAREATTLRKVTRRVKRKLF